MKDAKVLAEYEDGCKFERIVRNWLTVKGFDITEASPEHNIKLDIDLWLKRTNGWTSVSLKTNQPKYFMAPFCFEQQQVRRGKMVDSWYRTGRATLYFFLKRDAIGGGRLWILDKDKIRQYVNAHGWDADNVGISDERLEMQALNNMGNSHLSLLHQQTVLENGLGYVLADTSNLEQYNYGE